MSSAATAARRAKLTDDEEKNIPPANGRWDKARSRVLFVDRGDIVHGRRAPASRRQITRTTAGGINPRWAQNDTPSPTSRDGNLFIVPLDGRRGIVSS